MGIEGDYVGGTERGCYLTFRYRAHITDALCEDQIWSERLDSYDIDLVHAAIIAQRRAHGRIDLPAREASEIGPRSREPRPVGDALGIIAAVRDPDEPVCETECTDDLGGTGQQGH